MLGHLSRAMMSVADALAEADATTVHDLRPLFHQVHGSIGTLLIRHQPPLEDDPGLADAVRARGGGT